MDYKSKILVHAEQESSTSSASYFLVAKRYYRCCY